MNTHSNKMKNRMKTGLAVLLGAGCLGTADAATILIDLGRNATGQETTATGWNNVSGLVGGSEDLFVDNTPLVDSTGAASSISLSIVNHPSSAGASGSAADITATSLTSPTGVSYPTTAFQDSAFATSVGSITLNFSGFDSTKVYDLYFFGQGGNTSGTAVFTVTGSGISSVELDTAPTSALDFAEVKGVSADGNDEISIRFEGKTSTSTRWNTLEIVEVPEPGSLALLGLGGLLLSRRRRCD